MVPPGMKPKSAITSAGKLKKKPEVVSRLSINQLNTKNTSKVPVTNNRPPMPYRAVMSNV